MLTAMREKSEKEGSKRIADVKRLVELKNKHVAFHNKFPQSHRVCAICARANVSKKHKVRDAIFMPHPVSVYEPFETETSKRMKFIQVMPPVPHTQHLL